MRRTLGTIGLVLLFLAVFWLLLHNASQSLHTVHYRPRRTP